MLRARLTVMTCVGVISLLLMACSQDDAITRASKLRYDYKQVLNLSLLFYEAQRSGRLPTDNRIPWRGDSCLDDRGISDEDLSGGYYTQGITVKFMFPNAAAATVLAWGLKDFQDGYRSVGLYQRALKAVRWGADHLVKCHTSPNEMYAVIGDVPYETGIFWGRPEDITFNRPAVAVTTVNPGSELAAESAAALAASSLVVADKKTKDLYLLHARQLYDFATEYRGDYHYAAPAVTTFYKSWSGDEDELVWAAAWLYRATRDKEFLRDAENYYTRFNIRDRTPIEFSWDDKAAGVKILLYQLTQKEQYKTDAKAFCDLISSTTFKRTQKGLFFNGNDIGALRYSSNAAFVCLDFGETLFAQSDTTYNPYVDFALQQIQYALGDAGRSYLVGFGDGYPRFPYHSAASCKSRPAPCAVDDFNSPIPNPQVLYGALVGGPDGNDNYSDIRHWRQNGVAVDHNSGFQSAVAGFISLHEQGRLSEIGYDSGQGVLDPK